MYVPEGVIRPQLQIAAEAPVPTRFGTFGMSVFRWIPEDGQAANTSGQVAEHGLSLDHVALTMGDLVDARDVLVRVHSECLTSEVFGSLKCDCREQLEEAQAAIAREGRGAIMYLRQEGRGIGLANKIRAYELQSRGHDTVDANRLLGLPDDARNYGAAAAMLRHIGVTSVRLMTNNPLKVTALRELGIEVTSREPALIATNQHSALYLETKRDRMGHHLPVLFGSSTGDAE